MGLSDSAESGSILKKQSTPPQKKKPRHWRLSAEKELLQSIHNNKGKALDINSLPAEFCRPPLHPKACC